MYKMIIQYDERIKQKEAVIKVYGTLGPLDFLDFQFKVETLDPRIEKLYIDFSNLDYIGLTGIRALLAAQRRYKGNITIVNPSEKVYKQISKFGLFDSCEIKYDDKFDEDFLKHSVDYLNTNFKKITRDKSNIYGDEVFVVYQDKEYTWKQIEVISQIIAYDLSKLGIKQDDFVGISSIDSINSICTIFALAKLGATCVMLNPSYTANMLIELSINSDFDWLCYGELDVDNQDEVLAEIANNDSKCIKTFNIGSDIDFLSRENEYESIKNMFDDIVVENDDPSIMIFTSGSTGTPKGALHSYYTLAMSGHDIAYNENIRSFGKLVHTLPLYHIAGMTLDFMSALETGATLCIPYIKKGYRLVDKAKAITNTINKYNCETLNCVPAVAMYLYTYEGCDLQTLKNIKNLMICAQLVTKTQIDDMLKYYPNAVLRNLYGMTENIPISISSSEQGHDTITNTVGKASQYVSVKIINTNNSQECKINEAGEICVLGRQALGCYYKKSNESQAIDHEGYIQTGDLGFVDEEGFLHIVGRIKDIIIRGGENIMPKHVEMAIADLECISDVHVCGIPDGPMGEKVAAGVVLKDGYTLDVDTIKEELKKTLSLSEVPRVIKEYKEFPLLGNGKLDKITFKKQLEEFSQNK